MAKMIPYELCKKFKFDYTNKWYMHNPEPALKNETHKFLRGFEVQTNHLISARRSDPVIDNQRKDNLPNSGLCEPCRLESEDKRRPNNYRPITCLLMMWKILTAQMREKIYYSVTSRGLFPDEQKGCRTTVTLHRSTHPKWEQEQTEKSSYGLDWLQKDILYGSTKLDNKLPQNVQNITWSHKLYRKNQQNPESGADSRRKKLSWNKDPKRYFPRRCTINLTIHNSHDVI